MPTNEIFSFEILVNGQSLEEYNPQQDDYNYPACSNQPVSELDRVCYIQATLGSEFTTKITYLGSTQLSNHHAYDVCLFVDGKEVGGRIFKEGNTGVFTTINAKRVSGNLEQPYIFLSNHHRMKFSRIDFTEDRVDSGLRKESLGCIQLIVTKIWNVQIGLAHVVEPEAASDTSSLKVWEQDEKIAGKLSVATRYCIRLIFQLWSYSASSDLSIWFGFRLIKAKNISKWCLSSFISH
jgi:hypothetical protein